MENVTEHYTFIMDFVKTLSENFGVFGLIWQSLFVIILLSMIQQFKISKNLIHYTTKFEVQIQTIQQLSAFLEQDIKMIFDKFDEYDDLVQVFRGYFSVQIQDIVDILQDNLYNRGFAIEEIKSIFYRLQLKLLNLTEDLFVYLNIHNDDKLRQEMKNVLRDIFILRINLKFSNGDRKIIIDEIEKQFKTIEK